MSITLQDLVKRELSGVEHKVLLNGSWEEKAKLLQGLLPGQYVFMPIDVNVGEKFETLQNLREHGLKINTNEGNCQSEIGCNVIVFRGEYPMPRFLMVYRR